MNPPTPQQLFELTRVIKKCGDTVDVIMDYLFPNKVELRDLEDEYRYDYQGPYSYTDYVLDQIENELNKHNIVSIYINSVSGVIGDEPQPEYDHAFILYRYSGLIYRI